MQTSPEVAARLDVDLQPELSRLQSDMRAVGPDADEQAARAAEFDAAVGPLNPSPHVLALRDAREESAGTLSASEVAMASEEALARDSARLIYERAYTRAVVARDALRQRLSHGVPAIKRLPTGGYDGMVGLHQREVAELVNSYAAAARLLWEAAQMVCDIEELPDDGEAVGIKWGCPL